MPSRKKILVVQENLQPPGGGQGLTAWALQALADDYDLDVLTWVPICTEPINAAYGTRLRLDQFRVIEVPFALRALVNLDRDPYSLQPLAILSRYARMIHHRYDLVIGLFNEADFGKPALQYIHYPYFETKYRALEQARTSRRAQLRQIQEFYLRPWRVISGFDFSRMKQNITLVNSDWTGQQVQATYGISTRTLYPPVIWSGKRIPWSERAPNFVAVGRMTCDKRYDRLIEILRRVRERGFPVQLHLVAYEPEEHADKQLIAKLHARIAENSDWIHRHMNISRRELEQIVSTQRYGIHSMIHEHFGMAIAEMVRGGCVPFIHNSGGQVEIVDHEPRLMYDDVEDAVEKICRVLASPAQQAELVSFLAGRAELYSETRFMDELRAVVAAHVQDATHFAS